MASRSPTAITPLPKASAPGTPLKEQSATATTATPQPVPFPPPQAFDIIPPLHGLLLRLLSPQNNTEGAPGNARAGGDTSGASASQAQNQQQSSAANGNANNNENPQAGPSSGAPGTASVTAEIAALGSNVPPALDAKHLPTEVSSVKIRIQKAHAVVASLPDVNRSVAEQEAEIHELEDRIARLQSVISDFGKRASLDGSKKSMMDVS